MYSLEQREELPFVSRYGCLADGQAIRDSIEK